jgi:hypothetical protein
VKAQAQRPFRRRRPRRQSRTLFAHGDKVIAFFDKLLGDANAGKPLMRPYLENYFDLY